MTSPIQVPDMYYVGDYLMGGWKRFEPAANDTLDPQEQADLDRLIEIEIERSEGVDGWRRP